MIFRLRPWILAVIALVVAPLGASAQTFNPVIPDVPVLTQDGKSVHFYTDLVKGNTVAVQLTDFSVFYSQDSTKAAVESLKLHFPQKP